MTSPVNVGTVEVEVLASAKNLAKSLRKEFEDELKGLDVGKLIRASLGNTKIKLPVEPDVDTASIPEKVRRTSVPKVPVELDPLMAAFQAEVRSKVQALSRTANASIPVSADTAQLRAELGGALSEIQARSKIKVPTEPGTMAEYQAKLRAQLAEVAARVNQNVKVKVDVDKTNLGSVIGKLFSGASKAFPNFAGISASVADLGGALQKAVGSSAQLGGSLAGGLEAAAGPAGVIIGLLVAAGAAMAALSAAAVFAAPAMSAVAGAAAAIPGALVGAGAAIGALGLGFKGIADAFNPKKSGGGGGAGGSAVNQARQIAAASRQVEAAKRGIVAANRALESSERGLASAQRAVVTAQRAVTTAEVAYTQAQERSRLATIAVSKARVDAVEDIDDLNRALRGAKLSEEDAALGVTEALRALNEAKLTGNLPDIQRANLAYRQSLQTLDEAKDTTDDLQKSTTAANKAGVDGSDKVVQALQDQADATQGVKDAQQGIADAVQGVKDAQNGVLDAQNAVLSAQDGIRAAQDGLLSAQDSLAQSQQKMATGAAAAAAQVTKLAPAAQRFVDAIKALKPAFESLRLDVQQRLFEGLDKTVTNLGTAWIPALHRVLGSYADTFNNFFKNLGTSLGKPRFIADIEAGAEGARQGLSKIGDSITTSLVPAFGALSKAAGPFLSALGGEIAGIVTDFSKWVLQGEKSGALKTFFQQAAAAMHDLFTTGKLVASIIGSVIQIIVGSQPSGEKTPLQAFNEGLQQVSTWLNDPQTQTSLRSFFGLIGSAVTIFINVANAINGFVLGAVTKFTELKTTVGSIFTGVVGFFQGLPGRIGGAIAALPGTVTRIFSLMATRAGQIVGYGAGVVAGFFYRLPGQISAFIQSIPNRVQSIFNSVVAFAKSLPGRVMAGLGALRNLAGTIGNWLSNLPGQLWNIGQGLIIGLWNGITSMGGWLRDRILDFARAAISSFQIGFDSHSPSRLMASEVGITLPQGISVGMQKGLPRLLDDAEAMADKVAAAATPSMNTDLSLGIPDARTLSANLSAASQQQVLVGFDKSMTGDPLMDAFRKIIKVSYNGDPVAALTPVTR